MSSDRELLEKAARAAGYQPDGSFGRGLLVVINAGEHNQSAFPFNPLNDDGDALRLAVKLRIDVHPWGSGAAAVALVNNVAVCAEPHYGDDPDRATRRAIVRAAAALAVDENGRPNGQS